MVVSEIDGSCRAVVKHGNNSKLNGCHQAATELAPLLAMRRIIQVRRTRRQVKWLWNHLAGQPVHNLFLRSPFKNCRCFLVHSIHTYTNRVQWFLKLTMLHVVLDRQKISKTILEKAFFFVLWCFYLFLIFVLINFKIGSLRGENFFSWNRSYRVSKNWDF